MTAGMLAMILAIGMTACTKADNTTKTEKTSESDGKKELKKSDDRDTALEKINQECAYTMAERSTKRSS